MAYGELMAPRPKWWHMLQASKNEARLAVDLYNRSGQERQLEAFIVHMSMAWLKLLQASVEKNGGDLYLRDRRGRRIRHEDGDWKFKPLSSLLDESFVRPDPRRANLEFFIGLRNRIEHRHEKDIASLVAGKTQALLLNYEHRLVENFGLHESMSHELRFPLFVSTLTQDAVDVLKRVRERVPKGLLDWVQDFETGLPAQVISQGSYEFRVYLVPHVGPRTEADAVISFVKAQDLSEKEIEVMHQFQTIIREKKVPVQDLERFTPSKVVELVAPSLERPFRMHEHTQAWRYFQVRPASGAHDPTATKSDFCHFNAAFDRYVFTSAWVNFLIRKLADERVYNDVMAWRPSVDGPGIPEAD